MIKAIIFDCFGVLTITDIWREFWASLPPKVIPKAREVSRSFNRGEMPPEEFWQKITAVTGMPGNNIKTALEGEPVKNTRIFDYIRQLKKHYKIGLLSNVASDWITAEFLTYEEKKLFDAMVFSYELMITKPDPRTYKAILDKLGVKPEEAVMIDDIKQYCQAAEALGMQSVLYVDFKQMKQDLELILKAANSNN